MTMCPEAEIQFRLANNMVHALEKLDGTSERSRDVRQRMVKEYTRPAAGSDHLNPDILRPPKILLLTVRYLLDIYESEKPKQFNSVYSFVCDRFRAVRQDMILQNVSAEETLLLLDEMIPFYLETDYNDIMNGVIMISDIAWIQRGVAKKTPDKVKLDEAQMRQLIEGSAPDTSDVESDNDGEAEAKREPGVRGSAANEGTDNCEEAEMVEAKEEDEAKPESGMRGIAMYASNADDPYVTLHVDSDEEEKEEIEVNPDDNLVVLAKIDRDNYTLDVFLYNEENEDWYCHHDYILDAPPLCLEPIQHDPGNDETGKGNLISVGTMEPVINIWDLDIMNSVEPVVSLGSKSKGRRKKRDGSQQGHSDAVLGLAWNRITTHVLASGGADKQIVLWDLDEAKAAQVIPERDGEVQALSWHPAEASFILTGTLGGTVEVIDCRENTGSSSAMWNLGAQVEQVRWNHFNPFSAFVATDDGTLRHIDMRKPGEILWEGHAHDGSVGGLTLSATVRGLLVTVGHDQMLCVWKVQDDGSIAKVHSEMQHVGPLHAAQFNPDVATVCCIGGSLNDLVKLVDVGKKESVLKAFS
nr:SAC3 GANP Nin1 mts3 eIF-3 p25 and WD40 repeat domain containing protein [Haemonchus contortus]